MTFTIPLHDVDRAIADSEETGFVKIHVREGSDRIVGQRSWLGMPAR
jgi:pyruvate/2-oxoglutarate dehydrogenase complex dihydrolipoamide dehydrogenase (E3) component